MIRVCENNITRVPFMEAVEKQCPCVRPRIFAEPRKLSFIHFIKHVHISLSICVDFYHWLRQDYHYPRRQWRMARSSLMLLQALAAYLLGYGEVGLWLEREAAKPDAWVKREGNPYREWMEDYAGKVYQDT
ncbi:hypothetical protein L210DRAFT_2166374, partial [Boletus edulis BED1]